jgi:Carboxypeptidase regulatory-like domain/TonB-dependent Receptor Plug Domain/TonB dependent receptor
MTAVGASRRPFDIFFVKLRADAIAWFSPSKSKRGRSEEAAVKNISRNFPILVFAIIGLFAIFAARSYAQDATGRVVGNVTDPSGAPIEGAIVHIENVDTHVTEETVSDKDGLYQVLSLTIGNYDVTVQAAGFRTEVFRKQNLQIAQSLRLDAKLQIGQQTESIEVKDQASNVETVNQTVGATVVGEAIQQAPLNGRNVLDLAKLQAGVTETNGDSTAAGTFSIAGGRTDSVTFLLDGGLNNNLLDNSVAFNPNPDTIAEFRILESNYSAEYGRNGGGIISVVTKSGTDSFHGSGFEFLRNNSLNANSFFNNLDGLPRDVLKRNQYGGTLGGPIKKDKLFFFVGYQGQRLSSQQVSGDNIVYTPAELTGDFSQSGFRSNNAANPSGPDPGVVCFLTGRNRNALDPNSGQPLVDGSSCGGSANPFFQSNPALAFNGIIDPSKIDAVSQKYIAAGLLATSPSGDGNFQGAASDNTNELTIKVDYLIRDIDKVTVTLGGVHNPQLNAFPFATVPGFPGITQTNNYFGNLAYTHTFTANLLNELRLYVQRVNRLQGQPGTTLPTAAELGIGITPDQPTGPPNILFDNGLSLGFDEGGPTRIINNTFGFSDTLSYVHGRHNLKMGGGISAYQNNTVFDFVVNGEFDFNGSATGDSLADFLLGAPTQYFQAPSAPSNIRSKQYYGFFQDEWRITKKLSLNVGIRYEYSSPKYDTEGRSFSIIPGDQSTRFINAPVGLVFPGDAGAPKGANFPDKNDWAPRFGFAWDPQGNGKTSVRGGFGVFYDVLKAEDNLQFNGQPPFFGGAGLNFVPNTSGQAGPYPFFTDPFANASPPTPNSFPSKPPPSNIDFGAAGFLPFNSSGLVFVVDPHLRTPYTYQYNVSVQHEIVPSATLELSYVGSSSHGLTGLVDVNPFLLGTTDRTLNLTPGNSTCPDETSLGLQDPNNPPASPTCSFAGLPEFKNLTKASYNSLQASLTKQLTSSRAGSTYFTLAYTLSHAIDNTSGFRQRSSEVPSYSPTSFRASSDQDVRNRITFSGGWDLPFAQMWSSGPKRLTQGWSFFPIVTWHSGLPFDIFALLGDRFNPGSEGPSGAGDPAVVHANIVGSTKTFDPRKNGGLYFDPNSFSNAQCPDPTFSVPVPPPCTPGPDMLPSNSQVVANPALATYGTLPRNFLRGPGYINFDMAFSKTTAITERVNLELRAEFFNTFNHANFLNPGVGNSGNGIFNGLQAGNDPNAVGQFGFINATFDPRIIQLAARISF